MKQEIHKMVQKRKLSYLRRAADAIEAEHGLPKDTATRKFNRKAGERPTRREAWAKQELIYLARRNAHVRTTTIAEFAQVSRTYCSYAVDAVEARLTTEPEYKKRLHRIEDAILEAGKKAGPICIGYDLCNMTASISTTPDWERH